MLNSFVNFSTAALVTKKYRADIIVIGGSKLYAFVLILLSYLSASWLRFFLSFCLFRDRSSRLSEIEKFLFNFRYTDRFIR